MAAASVAPGMKVTASGRGAPGQRADTGDGKGMGGTGVVGIITGFGSICVNGQEIHYDGATPVSVDGAAASATGLTIGQLVSVRARGKGDSLLANSISVHSTLMGPVTWVSPKGDAFMALGQTVMLNQMDLPNLTRADASIKPGQRVRVSGLRDASGAIMATRVDKFPPGKAVQVTGPQAISPKSMGRIGELSISEVDKSQAGAFVQVRGRLSGEMLVAERVVPAIDAKELRDRDRVGLQGPVLRILPSGEMDLGYARVRVRVPHRDAVRPGQWVRVEAVRGRDGDLEVHRLERHGGDERRESGKEANAGPTQEERRAGDANTPQRYGPGERRERIEEVDRVERNEKAEKVEKPEKR